jgi:hypothetical protein
VLEIDLQVFRIANPDNTVCWDSKNPNYGAQFPIFGETGEIPNLIINANNGISLF